MKKPAVPIVTAPALPAVPALRDENDVSGLQAGRGALFRLRADTICVRKEIEKDREES